MGSCLSKRKRMSDAAVTHNASPRTSFSVASSNEMAHAKVSVISKNSERQSVEEATGHSALVKKSKSKKASQQESNNANDQKRNSSTSSLPSSDVSEANSSHNSPAVISRAKSLVKAADSPAKGDATSCRKMEPRFPSLLPSVAPSSPRSKAITGAVSDPLQGASPPANEGIHLPVGRTSKKRVLFQNLSENSQACGYIQQEHKVKKAEEQEEDEEEEGRPPPASKLKRSRSCEHSMRLDVKRPLRRITFQEDVAQVLSEVHLRHQKNKSNSTALLQPSDSKSSSHGESRCSKFLEGLDLIDILPSKPVVHNLLEQLPDSHEDEFLLHDSHQPEDPGRISADFFELKQRYLSSRSATCSTSASTQKDNLRSDRYSDHAGDGTVSFLHMHSRASSIDSVEPELYGSHKHPLFSSVAEEEDCDSDDSETFEFNQAVSVFSREGELKRLERLNTQSIAEEEEDDDDDGDDDNDDDNEEDERQDVDKYQVVATGDAVLVSGTNSEEFHLIPSKAYFERNNRNQHQHHHHQKLQQQQQQKKGSPLGRVSSSLRMRSRSSSPPAPPSSYLSVDEIICLLERDELDEEVLLSLLRCGGGSGGGTMCTSGGTPASEVASEASFEFKAGSTPPHSTPSTPMLSAGSTPTRQQGPASYINQLSPIALTPEEIAEIWGVFEQRQAISLA